MEWTPNTLQDILSSPHVAALLAKPPLTEEECIGAMLDLANTGAWSSRAWESMAGAVPTNLGASTQVQASHMVANMTRESLLPALTYLVATRKQTNGAPRPVPIDVQLMFDYMEDVLGRTLITLPQFTLTRAGLRMEHRMLATDVGGAVAYALILARTDPYRGRLRRCQYSMCGFFFLVPDLGKKAGRRRDTYCTNARCAEEGARERIRNHMRKKRAKVRSGAKGARR
jgi:hypothetical protein